VLYIVALGEAEEMGIKAVTQILLDEAGGPKNKIAPTEAKEENEDGNGYKVKGIVGERSSFPGDKIIHRISDNKGDQELEPIHDEKGDDAEEKAPAPFPELLKDLPHGKKNYNGFRATLTLKTL